MHGSVWRLTVVVVTLLTVARPAAADEASAAAKKVLTAQAAAIAKDDPDAMNATFTTDAFVISPESVFVGFAKFAPSEDNEVPPDATSWTGEHWVGRCTPKNVKVGSLGADAAWISADLAMREGTDPQTGMKPRHPYSWTVRVTEVVVRDGDKWHVPVAQFSVPESYFPDLVPEYSYDYAVPEPMPGATDDPDHAALLASPALLASKLAADKATTVIGTSAKEKAVGAAKAKKLLLKWKSLSFTVDGGVRWVASAGWAYAAAYVKTTVGKKTYGYRVLAVFRADGDDWEVASVHYSFSGT